MVSEEMEAMQEVITETYTNGLSVPLSVSLSVPHFPPLFFSLNLTGVKMFRYHITRDYIP